MALSPFGLQITALQDCNSSLEAKSNAHVFYQHHAAMLMYISLHLPCLPLIYSAVGEAKKNRGPGQSIGQAWVCGQG